MCDHYWTGNERRACTEDVMLGNVVNAYSTDVSVRTHAKRPLPGT